jgi:hypothetical protein
MEALLGSTVMPNGKPVYRACAANVGYLWRRYIGTPIAAGAQTAHIAGNIIADKGLMRSGYGPRGSVAYWNNSIGGGAGHVAINDGYGNTLNNWGRTTIDRTPLSKQTKGYRGWSYSFNSGGLVPGYGNFDKVPAMLTPGEMVINRSAVKSIGAAPLKVLNERGVHGFAQVKRAANGGSDIMMHNYNVTFEISGVSDPNEVADIVARKFERVARGKIRSA